MVAYRYSIGDHSLTGPEWGFDPISPSLTFYLTGQPHEFTCTIDGTSPAGLHIQELVQDVWVWRENSAGTNELLFRGPLIAANDVLNGDSHMITLTAHSYRERLAHWPIPNNPPGATTSLFPIGTATPVGLGWLAINLTCAHSDLAGILLDRHTASGTSTSQSAQSGIGTDAAIDAITQVTPFDWDLIPTADGKVGYVTWTPARGAAHPEYPLIYGRPGTGGNCTITRTFDLSTFGNEVWFTGQDAAGNPLTAVAPTTRTYGPEGLWIQAVAANTNTTGATTNANLQTQANNQLAQTVTPKAAYTVAVAEGWWPGPSVVWLGDSPTLVIKSGRLNVQSAARIQQIVIQPLDGAEQVSLTVGAKPIGKSGEFALARTLANMAKRMRALEWKQ